MPHPLGGTLKALVALPQNPADCWRWLGCTDTDGHARKTLDGESLTAQRWLWSILFGPVPDGLIITTKCGNKACPNPFHFVACHQADANRAAIGAVLMPADVVEIKRAKRHKSPITAGILAEKYGCSVQSIRDIWRGRTWSRKKAPNYGPKKAVA